MTQVFETWLGEGAVLPDCLEQLPELDLGAPWARALTWALLQSLAIGGFAAMAHAGLARIVPSSRARLRYAAVVAAFFAIPLGAAWTLGHELVPTPHPWVSVVAGEPPFEPPPAVAAHSAWDAVRAWLADGLAPLERWLAMAWIAGAALFAVRWCGAWLCTRAVARRIVPAHPLWQVHALRLGRRAGLARRVRLYTSRAIDVPMVIGCRTPRVVVPKRALETLPREELDALLLHEFAHVRRRDTWLALAQSFVEALFFYHPAIWWLSARVRAERECCCDADALAARCGRRHLARALYALESSRVLRDRRAVPLALAANDGSLLARIRRIARVRDPIDGRACRAAWIGAVSIGLVGIALGAVPARAPRQFAAVRIALTGSELRTRFAGVPIDSEHASIEIRKDLAADDVDFVRAVPHSGEWVLGSPGVGRGAGVPASIEKSFVILAKAASDDDHRGIVIERKSAKLDAAYFKAAQAPDESAPGRRHRVMFLRVDSRDLAATH